MAPRPSAPRSNRSPRLGSSLAAVGVAVLAAGTLPLTGAVAGIVPGVTDRTVAAPVHHGRITTPAAAPAVHAVATAPAGDGIIGEAPLPAGNGLWVAYADGSVVPIGAAVSYGDLAGTALNAPIRAIASTADGRGYWLLGTDGGIFSFGDARFYGSTGAVHLNQPIVGMAPTADDRGYWLVASDGGIFSFGDALFHGSTGGIPLDKPVVGMAAAPGGAGYWLVASDGGIFSFGSATFAGSTGALRLDSSVVGMASTSDGRGYWLVAADGGVFTFGDAGWHGSAAGTLGASDAVGIIPAHGGYWIPTTAGTVKAFGAVVPSSVPAPASAAPPVAATPTGPSTNPLADPAASETPPADFPGACYNLYDSTSCDAVALGAIDTARAREGLGALALPADFDAMGVVEQIEVVTNAERTSRGLPSLSASSSLDALAEVGAVAGTDPEGPVGVSWASNWAGGVGTPLAADYLWMYDDGLGSGNLDCQGTVTAGCWGHRKNILVPFSGTIGAATAPVKGWTSMTEVLAAD